MLSNNNKQSAEGNNNANIIQVGGDYTVIGITESQARDICKSECLIALQNWTFQASAIAERRILELENRLLPKILEHDEKLQVFGDPSFQIAIRKAQITAASTKRDSDIEMLSDLLLHRAQEEDRIRKLGINKAIEIVDQVDSNALMALSLLYVIKKFYPTSKNVIQGLGVLDRLYREIINSQVLPSGTSWIEHMELLSAIHSQPNSISSFKKFEEFTQENLDYYFIKGYKKDSSELNELQDNLLKNGIPADIMQQHPYLDGYMIMNTTDINSLYITRTVEGQRIDIPFSDEQKCFLQKEKTKINRACPHDGEVTAAYWKLWDSYGALNQVRQWWNQLPTYFSITQVGIALSNAYIHGVDKDVPCLY